MEESRSVTSWVNRLYFEWPRALSFLGLRLAKTRHKNLVPLLFGVKPHPRVGSGRYSEPITVKCPLSNPWKNKCSPWAHGDHGGHGSGAQWSQLSHGEVTVQSRRDQYDHGSVTARSQLNHGPGHCSVTAGCDHFGHRELTVSSLWVHRELTVQSRWPFFFSWEPRSDPYSPGAFSDQWW